MSFQKMENRKYVSRAGEKLEFAIKNFSIEIKNKICADFGASTGGFVDCLLRYGAKKVYAVEKGYGTLDWKLRNDKKVIVMERQNAMHVVLPEKSDLITIDTSWTKLEMIVPNALNNLKSEGAIIALLKPHYEAEPYLIRKGRLGEEYIGEVINQIKLKLEATTRVIGIVESPITGGKGKNKEFLVYLKIK